MKWLAIFICDVCNVNIQSCFTLFLFAEDFMKYLNISNSEEMDHLLKCLSEDMIQDDNNLSPEDIDKLCAEINFEEEIPEIVPSTTSTALPLSDITLGDELNLSNILDNETFSTPLQKIILDDDDFLQITSSEPMHMPKFDLDFNLDEILDQTDFSTQEVSAIAKEIEKVR